MLLIMEYSEYRECSTDPYIRDNFSKHGCHLPGLAQESPETKFV
jgi:hypothetical protein